MSGETEKQVSAWTNDTVLAYTKDRFNELEKRLDDRFAAQEKAVQSAFVAQQESHNVFVRATELNLDSRDKFLTALAAEREKQVITAFAAAKEAVAKAETSTERRFEGVNEFRAQLSDQASTFMPRREFEVQHGSLSQEVDSLRRNVDTSSYVTRELFDRYVKEQNEVQARTFDQLTVTYNDISTIKGRSSAFLVAITIFFTILTIASTFLARLI